jgi:glutaredoxin
MDSLLYILTKKNPILIISKPFCIQCETIKHKLKDSNFTYTIVDITTIDDEYDIDALTFVEELKNITGGTSYPFCFYEGAYIKMSDLDKKLIKFVFNEDTEDF